MTQNHSSSSMVSLQDILNDHDEWFSLCLPYSGYKPHPHQTFLTWLLKHVTPEKIAIFDKTKQIENTQTFFCSLTYALHLTCQCYGDTERSNNNFSSETLIPLTIETSLQSFAMIYIDICNQEIQNNPLLSLISNDVPKNTIFIFANLYSSNFIAKENRLLIQKLQQIYPYFEFSHHQGLLLLYTGELTNIKALNELFSLKDSPKLEQNFKARCALLDDYWQLKINSIQNQHNKSTAKEQVIEAKTESYLLQQDIYYKEKNHKKEVNNLKIKTANEIQSLQTTINYLYNKINHIELNHNEHIQHLKSYYNEHIEHIKSHYKEHVEHIKSHYNALINELKINHQEKINYIEKLTTTDSQSLKKATDHLFVTLQNYQDAYENLSVWRENTETKINSIEYLLKKYRIISFFFPHKLKQLLTFTSAPNLTSIDPLTISEKKLPELKLPFFLAEDICKITLPPPLEHDSSDQSTLLSPHFIEPEIIEPALLVTSEIKSPIPPFVQEPIIESPNRPRRIIFVAGEPDTPGVIYRCERNAAACKMAGHEAKVINAANIGPDDIQWADILILWRVEFSGHILGIIDVAKEFNTLTAFDADDIVFKPHFAYIEIIDGIRTIGTTEAETSRTFGNMRQTLMRTDFAVATTQEMREHMAQELIPKHAGPLVFTLPNIFDDDCVRISRFFNRIQKANKNDDYIRIGYASGTRTHQRDFALVIPALLSIFNKRPKVRLVLFREPGNHRPILHMNEFPELNDFQDRIEWRDTVPLKQLPTELARFDISIAPLEVDNVFCNAKSELKFFEAALVNACSVVSPTGPLTRCVQHGITGFLAKNIEEWETYLLTLIDDESLRFKMAQSAYHDVLWNFSMQRQSYLCDTMLLSLTSEKDAAQAMETMIARKEYKSPGMPIIPESELLFSHDDLQESEVTVIITSYNYSEFIIEAMESVKAQSLKHIDMIIVDDGSSDDSIDLIIAWATKHKNRFNRLQLYRSLKNVGLGGARNIGIAASETLYSMQLDADNRLLPNTCETLLTAMQDTAIGYAYPYLRHFGAGEASGGEVPFHPLRLTVGNYIDAMVMLAKWAWAAAGGYYVQRDAMGWEDYDLWCRLAKLGIQGTQVKDATAEYRAHFSSMTNTVTEQTHHKPKVTSYLAERHPWIKIVVPEFSPGYERKID